MAPAKVGMILLYLNMSMTNPALPALLYCVILPKSLSINKNTAYLTGAIIFAEKFNLANINGFLQMISVLNLMFVILSLISNEFVGVSVDKA